jgi:carbamate kinase
VPSPEPLGIIELEAIRHLVEDGYVVTAVGGGGIPVTRDAAGDLKGVEVGCLRPAHERGQVQHS